MWFRIIMYVNFSAGVFNLTSRSFLLESGNLRGVLILGKLTGQGKSIKFVRVA